MIQIRVFFHSKPVVLTAILILNTGCGKGGSGSFYEVSKASSASQSASQAALDVGSQPGNAKPSVVSNGGVAILREAQQTGAGSLSGATPPSVTVPNDYSCGAKKVNVCHHGASHSNTLCISENAVSAHVDHGDQLGACVPF